MADEKQSSSTVTWLWIPVSILLTALCMFYLQNTGIITESECDLTKAFEAGQRGLHELALQYFEQCSDAEAQWNAAVSLRHLGRNKEADDKMRQVLEQFPGRTGSWKDFGLHLLRDFEAQTPGRSTPTNVELNNRADEGLEALERYLSISYGDVEQLLRDQGQREKLFRSRRDLSSFIPAMVSVYQKRRQHGKAYKYNNILVRSNPDDPAIINKAATLGSTVGDITSVTMHQLHASAIALQQHTLGELQQKGEIPSDREKRIQLEREVMEESWNQTKASALINIAATLEGRLASIAQEFFELGNEENGAQDFVEALSEFCGVNVSKYIGHQTTPRAILVNVSAACYLHQNALQTMYDLGSDLEATTRFGWTPLHHVVGFGALQLVEKVLSLGADVKATTTYGFTALHIAAMRGANSDLVDLLLTAGVSEGAVDMFGRTAFDIACLHRWGDVGTQGTDRAVKNAFMRALNANREQRGLASLVCKQDPADLIRISPDQEVPATNSGGWSCDSDCKGYKELYTNKCNIHIVDGTSFTPEQFVEHFLTVERPVVIRGYLANWTNPKFNFSKAEFVRNYRETVFRKQTIPYATAFGIVSNTTTVGDFVSDYMKEEHQKQCEEGVTEERVTHHPDYIFETLPETHDLLQHHSYPPVFDPAVTNITARKVQFFVGPPLSGAPIHFHRSAWNGMFYGMKRWFLYPPSHSMYSRKNIHQWFQEDYQDPESGLRSDGIAGEQDSGWPLECVQRANDIAYVPDFWGHGVINLCEGIGFASELEWGAVAMFR